MPSSRFIGFANVVPFQTLVDMFNTNEAIDFLAHLPKESFKKMMEKQGDTICNTVMEACIHTGEDNISDFMRQIIALCDNGREEVEVYL